MIQTLLTASLILFGVAISITLVRIIIGPSLPDRILSLDIIGVQLVSTLAIVSILLETLAFLEVILVLAILAFISTISFAKYMERGLLLNASVMIEYISVFLIFSGSVFAVIGAIGHIRFPDVYTRAHSATKSSTIAVLITLTGALIYISVSQGFFSVRLLLGIFFVYLTSPVSSQLILRAAYRRKVKLADITIEDALEEVIHGKNEQVKENTSTESSN